MTVSTGKKTFYDLGIDITGFDNIEEAIKHAKLDWTVHLEPIQTVAKLDKFVEADGDGEPIFVQENVLDYRNSMVIRDDTVHSLGVVGNGYIPFQNVKAAAIIEKLIENHELELMKAGCMRDGGKMWMTAKMPESFQIGDQEIECMVLVSWSHTGEGKVRAAFIPYHVNSGASLVCDLEGVASHFERKHTKNVHSSVQTGIDVMKKAKEYFEKFQMTIEELIDSPMGSETMEKFLEEIFPSTDGEKKGADTMRENKRNDILDKFSEQHDDISGTKLAGWFAVCEYVDDIDGMRTRTTKGQSREEKKLEQIWFGGGAKQKVDALKKIRVFSESKTENSE